MNSKYSKASDPDRLQLNRFYKINLKKVMNMLLLICLSHLSMCYT